MGTLSGRVGDPGWAIRGAPALRGAGESAVGLARHPANPEGAPCPALQLSGLFQLDDSDDTCSPKSAPDPGERVPGGKGGDD